jgi:hypothetical protein
MPTLRNQKTRSGLTQRLQQLTPETKPQWGKLDAPRLLCHLADTLDMALGKLPAKSVNTKAFQHFPLKHFILYVLRSTSFFMFFLFRKMSLQPRNCSQLRQSTSRQTGSAL